MRTRGHTSSREAALAWFGPQLVPGAEPVLEWFSRLPQAPLVAGESHALDSRAHTPTAGGARMTVPKTERHRVRALLVLAFAAIVGAHSVASAAPAPALPEHPELQAPVRYTLGLLERGPAWTPERSARTDSIQAGHMANIGRMAKSGALIAAGPFENGGELRGAFVFAPGATGLDSLMAGDPAIASRRLVCRLYPWLAPPGLGDDYRRRAEARGNLGDGHPDSMLTFGWVMLHRGPRYDSSPTPAVLKLLASQRDYTERLRADGTLLFAGSIDGAGELRGVLVMQGDSATVARAVIADPAVRAGRFTPRILRWWTAWGTIPGH